MTQELLYTSAPHGLKPGSCGFCTVVSTQGMTSGLADRLESLSGFRHAFLPQDAQADLNPIVFSHLQLAVSGKPYHLLSRIAAAGLDYTQRTNKIAHHVLLEPNELVAAGPAWLLAQPGFMQPDWDGKPRVLASGRRPPSGTEAPAVCHHWAALTGDAGWGGRLAETAISDNKAGAVLIFRPGIDVLSLVTEALALLPVERRWEVTFSTYYTKLPPGIDCLWRFVLEGSPEASRMARTPGALVINLGQSLGKAEGGPYVAAARTGQVLATVGRDETLAATATPPRKTSSLTSLPAREDDLVLAQASSPRTQMQGLEPPPTPNVSTRTIASVAIPHLPQVTETSKWPWIAMTTMLLLLTVGVVATRSGFLRIDQNKQQSAPSPPITNNKTPSHPITTAPKKSSDTPKTVPSPAPPPTADPKPHIAPVSPAATKPPQPNAEELAEQQLAALPASIEILPALKGYNPQDIDFGNLNLAEEPVLSLHGRDPNTRPHYHLKPRKDARNLWDVMLDASGEWCPIGALLIASNSRLMFVPKKIPSPDASVRALRNCILSIALSENQPAKFIRLREPETVDAWKLSLLEEGKQDRLSATLEVPDIWPDTPLFVRNLSCGAAQIKALSQEKDRALFVLSDPQNPKHKLQLRLRSTLNPEKPSGYRRTGAVTLEYIGIPKSVLEDSGPEPFPSKWKPPEAGGCIRLRAGSQEWTNKITTARENLEQKKTELLHEQENQGDAEQAANNKEALKRINHAIEQLDSEEKRAIEIDRFLETVANSMICFSVCFDVEGHEVVVLRFKL